MSTPVGTLLSGRYRLDAQVGAGGMSTVYRAFDTVLERQVAIKLMHREIASDSDQLERFRREARAVAQLNHPHIVGGHRRRRGRRHALHRPRVRRGRDAEGPHPPPRPAADPRGGRLRDRDRPRARRRARSARSSTATSSRRTSSSTRRARPRSPTSASRGRSTEEGLTADGRVLGTTDYVSPEQALGQAVTGQRDLYSLGVVLFEMLTGDVPFHGENQVAVAMKHVREELPDVQVRRPRSPARWPPWSTAPPRKDLDAPLRDAPGAGRRPRGGAGHRDRALGRRPRGEATAVLRTLPEDAQRRVPLRAPDVRPRRAASSSCSAMAAIAVIFLLVGRTERGTGTPNFGKAPAPGLKAVSLKQSGAQGLRPARRRRAEHPDQAKAVVDGDPRTTWATENYDGGELGNKPGVGHLRRRRPGRGRRRHADHHAHEGLRRDVYARRRAAAAGAGDSAGRVGVVHVATKGKNASTSHGRAGATATTSCGSPSCRRARAASKIARSASSAARADAPQNAVGALARGGARRASAARRSTSSG